MDDVDDNIDLTFVATTHTISFTSNYDWTAKLSDEAQGWISIDKESGAKGNHTISLDAKANKGEVRRNTSLTLAVNGEEYIIEIEQMPLTIKDLADGTIPDFDVWNISDAYISNTYGIRNALTIIEGKGRQITIRLPFSSSVPGSMTTQMNHFGISNADLTSGLYPERYETNTSLVAFEAPKATAVNNCAFMGSLALRSVDIPNVTTITDAAFYATGLISVDMPKVTEVYSGAFGACHNLESVKFDALKSIDTYAFSGCKSLKGIALPSVVEVGGYGFINCSSLKEVDMPRVEESSGGAFDGCISLTKCIFALDSQLVVSEYRSYSGSYIPDHPSSYSIFTNVDVSEPEFWIRNS